MDIEDALALDDTTVPKDLTALAHSLRAKSGPSSSKSGLRTALPGKKQWWFAAFWVSAMLVLFAYVWLLIE